MKSNLLKLSLIAILYCGLIGPLHAQINAIAIAHADSSRFSPNGLGGWQLLNSYVAAVGADSVQVELIIQNSDSLNWGQLQLLGTIKGSTLFPSTAASVTFFILDNQYLINIAAGGRCYLKLLNGGAPSSSPAVIPLRVVYKL